MRKRNLKNSTHKRASLNLQRRATVRRRQRLANRRQVSQWMMLIHNN